MYFYVLEDFSTSKDECRKLIKVRRKLNITKMYLILTLLKYYVECRHLANV